MSLISDLPYALKAETIKLRGTKVPLLTLCAYLLLPLIVALFMAIMKNPDQAKSLGILGAKAQLAMAPFTLETYLTFSLQAFAMGSFFLCSILIIWLFGRENTEKTVKLFLATKTSRTAVVTAKGIVFTAVSLVAFFLVALAAIGLGLWLEIPGTTEVLVQTAALRGLTIVALTWALMPFTAWIATVGKGYMAPISATVGFVFLSQIVAVLGWGPWFPWALPFMISRVEIDRTLPFDTLVYIESVALLILGWIALQRSWTKSDRLR